MKALRALVRGPVVLEEVGGERRARPLDPPRPLEFGLSFVVCAAAMLGLYAGLGPRNAALAESGAAILVPRTSLDDAIPLVPVFVFAYLTYFPLLLSLALLALRDRRVMYEGVIGYVGGAAIGFLFFWLLPSRMIQPDLSACEAVSCRTLTAMQRVDDGFNVLPSMHVAYSTIVWLFFRRYMPEVARAVGALVLLIILSTVLCKRHYVVDIPAGVVVAVVVYASARRYGAALASRRRGARDRATSS